MAGLSGTSGVLESPPPQTFQPAAGLPNLIDEEPGLSARAMELARSLPSFTKGQLAFYALKKDRIRPDDAEAIINGDNAAQEEYRSLIRFDDERGRQDNPLKLGTATVGIEFQAYQPRVNRLFGRSQSDPRGAYSLYKTTIEGDEFIDRIKALAGETQRPKDDDVASSTFIGEMVRNTIIPIMVMGEMSLERGVENALTLTLPEVSFKLVKRFYPKIFERLRADYAAGALDVGLSNAHHSIAPLLSRDDLKREYAHSLDYYRRFFAPADGKVTLHIPEEAKTGELLQVLTEVQKERKVEFIVCFDSKRHNPGIDITKATRFENASQPSEVTALFRAFDACDKMAFNVINGGDPLSGNERSQRNLTQLNPDREQGWAKEEAQRLFKIFVSDLFGTETDPEDRKENRHDTWRKPLYDGRNSAIVIANDAEFIGIHHPGEAYPFQIFLETLGEFGIETASFRKTLGLVGQDRETVKRLNDSSWSGEFSLWINPGTQWLRDTVGATLTAYKKPLQHVTDLLERHNPELTEERMPKELNAAWENYGLSLISCPYWWSWAAGYPESIPVIHELFRNMASCGRDLDLMMGKILETPGDYHLELQEADISQLQDMQRELREADKRFRENPAARQYESFRKILDGYRRLDGGTEN